MSSAVLPAPEEIPDLVPGPRSTTWRYAGDARILATAGYVLLLQVAHPTVGAGVAEHSDFVADPWGRLLRTLDFTYVLVYGGPEAAAATGRRVREMHRNITGTAASGQRYHAWEPEAYAWVHATLGYGIVEGRRRFADPVPERDLDPLWAEWVALGRVLGVREGELPGDWDGFRAYFDAMVQERLEDNRTVHDVLGTLRHPKRPPVPLLPDPLWALLRIPLVRLLSLATVGLMPAVLRERLGVQWSRREALEFGALAGSARALTPVLPGPIRNTGPLYLRWRREALERGDHPAFIPPAARAA